MSRTARKAAYDALTAVTKNGAYTALALKKHIPDGLSDEDKRFAALLTRTALENLIRIDYALDKFIRSGRVHGSVRNVLRLGACQILYMETEPYAAVNESVALMKAVKPQLSGFVNAVLRALAGGKNDIAYPQGQNAEALSVACSYPLWICEKYIADFDYDFARRLLSYTADKGTAIRANALRTDGAALGHALDALGLRYTPGQIADAYAVHGLMDIEHLEIYQKGWIAVQSESAMRAVLAMDLSPRSRLLDCCAAPGGKSAYAAALMSNTLEITAWDIHAHRVDMTNKNYARLGVENAKAVLHDARAFEPGLESTFDAVMVDAPCSAMGLMARNPDIRYTRSREDIAQLCLLQHDILSACARYVKPGGTLAYFTCSVNKEENEQVTDGFIHENGGFAYKKAPQTLYPHITGSDGFYIAVMRKTL